MVISSRPSGPGGCQSGRLRGHVQVNERYRGSYNSYPTSPPKSRKLASTPPCKSEQRLPWERRLFPNEKDSFIMLLAEGRSLSDGGG
jgi:hypothetical protein